jgi:Zn-dependent M28 family amino/carboxypeptidase
MLKAVLLTIFLSIVLPVALLVVLTVQPVLRTPQAGYSPAVDPVALESHVKALSQTFHPRSYDHPENLKDAADYIERHFVAAGGRTHRQSFMVGELEYDNVIADFGPEDGPVLIVGAHYDSYGENYRKPPLYTPGADDNASGVAGLLALADLLGRYPPTKRVQLVAYCLEEPPFFDTMQMGSAVHAAATHDSGVQVIGMMSLEMIGYFSDAPGSQDYPADFMKLVYPDTGNFIGVVGRFQDMALTRTIKQAMRGASDLPVHSINTLPVVPGVDFSDHKSYWQYGYKAVMITDTAFYRNPTYHTENDTADQLDYERMAKVVQGLFASIASLTE